MDGDSTGGEDETIRVGHSRERSSVGLHVSHSTAFHGLGANRIEQILAFGQLRGFDCYT